MIASYALKMLRVDRQTLYAFVRSCRVGGSVTARTISRPAPLLHRVQEYTSEEFDSIPIKDLPRSDKGIEGITPDNDFINKLLCPEPKGDGPNKKGPAKAFLTQLAHKAETRLVSPIFTGRWRLSSIVHDSPRVPTVRIDRGGRWP